MSGGRLAYQALAALKTTLEAAHADIAAADVSVVQQPPGKVASYPAIAIMPQGRADWRPHQPEVVRDGSGDAVFNATSGEALYEMATLDGRLELWVAHKTPAQREVLEDRITQAFHQDEVAGRLQATVADVELAGVAVGLGATITWSFGPSTGWEEEMAFAERRWSRLEVEYQLPVWTHQSGVYKLTDARLVFDIDLEADLSSGATPADKIVLIDDPEQYNVDEDGNLTAI